LPTFPVYSNGLIPQRNTFASNEVIFSERELTFTFAICHRPSVCRLSVCHL